MRREDGQRAPQRARVHQAPYGCAANLLGLSLVSCLIATGVWDLGLGAAMWAGCGTGLLLFAAIAVLMNHFRDVREAGYGSELSDAARLAALVLHRVSIAVPLRAADALAGDVEPGKAHRLFERLEPHLGSGARLAHAAEPLERDADPEAALDAAARALEDRTRDEASQTYREQARASAADAGESGLVVASVLVVVHPTATAIGPVHTVAEARKLADRILPITPAHIRAARVVITPASGQSLDAEALAALFPELAPLSLAPRVLST